VAIWQALAPHRGRTSQRDPYLLEEEDFKRVAVDVVRQTGHTPWLDVSVKGMSPEQRARHRPLMMFAGCWLTVAPPAPPQLPVSNPVSEVQIAGLLTWDGPYADT